MAKHGTASVSTDSNYGFKSFDELCRGVVKYYSFHLVDLRNKSTRERIKALIDKVHDTITSLEFHSEKKIQHFCNGKTFAQAKARTTFNSNDDETWRVQGIADRWRKYDPEGCDGLVVLGAVSRDILKKECNKDVWNQQMYTLALENALITHFAYDECDRRLVNDSIQQGKLQPSLSAGYVVYMAFRYE